MNQEPISQSIIDQIDRPYRANRRVVDINRIATAVIAALLIGIAIGSSCTNAQGARRAELAKSYPALFAGEPGQWGQE